MNKAQKENSVDNVVTSDKDGKDEEGGVGGLTEMTTTKIDSTVTEGAMQRWRRPGAQARKARGSVVRWDRVRSATDVAVEMFPWTASGNKGAQMETID